MVYTLNVDYIILQEGTITAHGSTILSYVDYDNISYISSLHTNLDGKVNKVSVS
jgi:hypothetical protein